MRTRTTPALCAPDSLDPAKVDGTIVVCLRGVYDRVAKSAEVKRAGGMAMVLINPTANSLDADFHSVPTMHLSDTAGEKVFDYLDSAGRRRPQRSSSATSPKLTTPLPQVAGFSSRGPTLASERRPPEAGHLGARVSSVLAAVSPAANAGRDYDLYSGTSMAAPHIAGLAAFIQSVTPAAGRRCRSSPP